MNRIGVNASKALEFARKIKSSDNLIFEGIFTHFATAEEPTNPMAALQLEKFEKVLDEIEMAGLTPKYIHAANSAAALRIPSSRFSMVRVGICAYGIYPDARGSDVIELKLALSLITEISFLKQIEAGESVSYGARFTTDKDTQIATLPIGYGDGVPRNYGLSGGSVLIHGIKCPIVGRVTMDQTMVDVGDLSVKAGDKVTMIGTDGNSTISTTEWGDLTGTISYEILCRLNERLPRVYD
ncbi:MAG TPA: alanine racemase, partial [Acidimicrobiia bacterium]|nr:alanine racemase [Acidimicrobiia bacterium]